MIEFDLQAPSTSHAPKSTSARPAGLGVSRNLTETFALLRTNASQSRFSYTNRDGFNVRATSLSEEKMSLVSLEDGEDRVGASRRPPQWVHMLDEVDYEFTRIRSRILQLRDFQKQHLSRPSFGEEGGAGVQEQNSINEATDELTSMLAHAQRLIHVLQQSRDAGGRAERSLRENAVTALSAQLASLTTEMREHQSTYLKAVQSRVASVDAFLLRANPQNTVQTDLFELMDRQSAVAADQQQHEQGPQSELMMSQVQAIMQSEQTVKQREREVLSISSSIAELNTLFKDVAQMVVDQGSILDRIDYNVEQSSIRVGRALDSVQKAAAYQGTSRKMQCITCLAIAIVFVGLLIILTKF